MNLCGLDYLYFMIDIIPHSKIIQAWRTRSFKESDEDSNMEIILNEIKGKTELALTHSNIPS